MILNTSEVRERLRAAIADAGSQREFARRIGMSDVYLGLVRRGLSPPGRALLKALRLRETEPTYEEIEMP